MNTTAGQVPKTAARERPILFSAPMVQAILAGRKTQTRRVAKFIQPSGAQFQMSTPYGGWFGPEDRVSKVAPDYAPFAVGDRLWVKETWRAGPSWDDQKPSNIPSGVPVDYTATPRENGPNGKTRVSIFMPRWASRITLFVTDVRVERLQDISQADAVAEGAFCYLCGNGAIDGSSEHDCGCFHSRDLAVPSYRYLWDSINGPGAWEANPWIVAVSFEVREGNIDA